MSAADAEVAGVRITHADRVVYPDVGLTKLDLARFYAGIARWILPHVEGRPLTLVRCPEGLTSDCFYMKHSNVWAPPALRRVRIKEQKKIGDYLVVESVAGLVSLVQMGILEIHTWNSRIERVERPDRLVFDLDPGPGTAWTQMIGAARLIRSVLRALRLESFVKTTGGAGLHVVVPLAPERNWAECLAFARAVAEAIVGHDPALYTTSFPKRGRERKILIDYLRNNRTNTSIAAFSTRARGGAPVSLPIGWDELTPRLRSDAYTVRNVPRRLARLRNDPWKASWKARQRIGGDAFRALGAAADGR